MTVELNQNLLNEKILELRQIHDLKLVDLIASSKSILEDESLLTISDALPRGAAARIIDQAILNLKAAEIEFHSRHGQLDVVGITYSDIP